MLQVVLRLKQHFFADEETLKSIASHLFLELFGESYDDAMFLEVRPPLPQMGVSPAEFKFSGMSLTYLRHHRWEQTCVLSGVRLYSV